LGKKDLFVYKHDVYGDEATNKDASNSNNTGTGNITWTTDLHGCGYPEAQEQPFDLSYKGSCTSPTYLWHSPSTLGPLTYPALTCQ
jgi:hypothetical protein